MAREHKETELNLRDRINTTWKKNELDNRELIQNTHTKKTIKKHHYSTKKEIKKKEK